MGELRELAAERGVRETLEWVLERADELEEVVIIFRRRSGPCNWKASWGNALSRLGLLAFVTPEIRDAGCVYTDPDDPDDAS